MTTVLIPNVPNQDDATTPVNNGLAGDVGVRARMARAMEKTPFDFHTPHVTARQLVDLMDGGNARDTVKQNWLQMLTALLPIRTKNSGGNVWSTGITSDAKIKKNIARDLENSKVFGKGIKDVAVTGYNAKGGEIYLNVVVGERPDDRTEHNIGIHTEAVLWLKQSQSDATPTIVCDDNTGCIQQIRRIAYNNDPAFRLG